MSTNGDISDVVKYLLILIVCLIGGIFTLPDFWREYQHARSLSERGVATEEVVLKVVKGVTRSPVYAHTISFRGGTILKAIDPPLQAGTRVSLVYLPEDPSVCAIGKPGDSASELLRYAPSDIMAWGGDYALLKNLAFCVLMFVVLPLITLLLLIKSLKKGA